MREGNLICIIGVDGAGKTTQARDLTKYLVAKGFDAKYIYGRYVPILTRPLVVMGATLLETRTTIITGGFDFTRYTSEKTRILERPFMRTLVNTLVTAEYVLQLVLKIGIPVKLGKTVISDRYIHDTVATDLAPNIGFGNEDILSAIRRMLVFAPKPSALIYIRIEADIAFGRKSDIMHIDYLRKRIGIYDFIAESYGATLVDGEKEPKSVRDEVRRIADGALNKSP